MFNANACVDDWLVQKNFDYWINWKIVVEIYVGTTEGWASRVASSSGIVVNVGKMKYEMQSTWF